MTEYEKAQAGYLYDANYDRELAIKKAEARRNALISTM